MTAKIQRADEVADFATCLGDIAEVLCDSIGRSSKK
jgi:hypothetical protein